MNPLIVLPLLACLLSVRSPAQDGTLTGKVTNDRNRPECGTVVLSDTGRVTYRAQINRHGVYLFEHVPAGIYSVEANPCIYDYRDGKKNGIKIEAGKTLELNIQLENKSRRKRDVVRP